MKQRIYRCRRCKHVWNPRKLKKPRSCPNCRSAFWDRSNDLIMTRKRLTPKLQKRKARELDQKKYHDIWNYA